MDAWDERAHLITPFSSQCLQHSIALGLCGDALLIFASIQHHPP